VASYRVLIKPSAVRELEEVPLRERRRLADRIRGLASEPRPPGVQKLSGRDRYRVRQGSYRVVYAIDDPARTVTVVRIGHRREVYR
jgi:mRNA interferase RelE/StbE